MELDVLLVEVVKLCVVDVDWEVELVLIEVERLVD